MNFTEWTNKVLELERVKGEALIRHSYAEELLHRAYFEYPQDSAVMGFISRAEQEARQVYETAHAALKAVLDEKQPTVTDSEVAAGDDGSVTLAVGWHTLPDGRKLYEHGQSANDDDAEYRSSWRQEIVEEAIREDGQNGR